MKLYTEDKDEVDLPEWVGGYEVGDEIAFINPRKDKVETSEVIGFSTREKNPGLPVIDPPSGLKAREIAVDEDHHYNKNDLKQNAD